MWNINIEFCLIHLSHKILSIYVIKHKYKYGISAEFRKTWPFCKHGGTLFCLYWCTYFIMQNSRSLKFDYFISETSRSLSVLSRWFKKIYRVENVCTNIFKSAQKIVCASNFSGVSSTQSILTEQWLQTLCIHDMVHKMTIQPILQWCHGAIGAATSGSVFSSRSHGTVPWKTREGFRLVPPNDPIVCYSRPRSPCSGLVHVVCYGLRSVSFHHVLKLSIDENNHNTQFSALLGIQRLTVQASISPVIKFKKGAVSALSPSFHPFILHIRPVTLRNLW